MRMFSIYNILLLDLSFFKRLIFFLLIFTAIRFLIFIILVYNLFEMFERKSSALYHSPYGPANGPTTGLAQDIKTEEIRNVLFKIQPENRTIQSFIRSAERKSLINKIKIDPLKLSEKYRYNSTYTNMEKMFISSECMNIYPFNEGDKIAVNQSNYQQVSLQTSYGNTPIALNGAGDLLSDWLRSGVSFEPQLKEGMLNFLNTDPQLASLDIGAMLGSQFL